MSYNWLWDQEPNDKNEDEKDKEDEEMVKDKKTDDSKVQVLRLAYVKGVSEKIQTQLPHRLGVKPLSQPRRPPTGDGESKKPSTSQPRKKQWN